MNMNMKRKPTKNQNRSNQPPSQHTVTLHQRLHQALNLGIKYSDGEGRKWQSTDIEIQKLAGRSISAFLGCISPDTLQHPLVKDSVADIVLALVGFTQSRNEVVLRMAAELTATFVGVLGNLVPFHLLSKLVSSFSCLLSFHQSSVAASCASALDLILSKITPRRLKSHNEIWDILKESKAVDCITCNLQDSTSGSIPYEYFQAMASLLKTIMLRWPPSRYPVWSNEKFLEGLEAICIRPNSSAELVVLHLFSAIALCGSGADKLLQKGDTFLSLVLHCMDNSQPYSVRVEAFKLTESLVRSEKRWLRIATTYLEPIVKAIVDAMGGWSLCSGKVASDQLPLLTEACKLALITRWSGEHHIYFWKLKVDTVLLDLLIDNFQGSKQSQNFLSLKEVIATARKGLDANNLGVLRPYVWAIMGWLATHCPEDFTPSTHGNNCLHTLITCGCLILMDTVHKGRQNSLDVFLRSKLEPAFRAVFLMVHSTCKYIASQARDVLSELSTPDMEVYLKYILGSINFTKYGESFSVVNKDQIFMDLIILSCLSALPKYQNFIIQNDGIKILSAFANWCLSHKADDSSRSQYMSNRSTCCQLDIEDWEGEDTLLFFSLWGLNELIQHSGSVKSSGELMSSQVVGDVNCGVVVIQNLVDKLQEISGSTSSSAGLRWCAASFCSFFGLYGFPSRFGRKSGDGIHENELADLYLKLSSGECLRVHSVILKVRCPSMLPSGELSTNKRMYDLDVEKQCRNFQREVRLSARVDYKLLMKLLEFIYMGYVQVDDDLVKQLKLLAKGCDLHSLSHLLGRKRPKWGTAVPCCDFTLALGPSGRHFSDVILEAKANEVEWSCNSCSLSLPHIHVHKIILWLSSDYFKALFHSGMQESHSQIIKVPVSWEALSKLVYWFYSDGLPKPSLGCIWANMSVERQLREVHAYVELSWLAQFWIMEDFRDETLRVTISCLTSSRHLPLEIIKIAFEFSQWEIVEVAANCLAPAYPQLRDSGDLVHLNEVLVDMVRVAYVRLSQAGDCDYSD